MVVALCLCTGPAWSADGTQHPPAGPVLALPGAKEPARLRLDLTVDGHPPAAAWDAFLDRLFDHFDQDGDGSLGRDEVRRMMPLPLPGRNELAIDLARLDADGNG
jgi:hypothetical protein